MLERAFVPATRTQFLRVQSDRLPRWHVPGMLFLGDAAHTMSPVAGQGINVAIRDAVVAANHILAVRARGGVPDDAMCARVQAEREPEVRAMQAFQSRLGYFMLGAPRRQTRAFFRAGVPLLGALGVRRSRLCASPRTACILSRCDACVLRGRPSCWRAAVRR